MDNYFSDNGSTRVSRSKTEMKKPKAEIKKSLNAPGESCDSIDADSATDQDESRSTDQVVNLCNRWCKSYRELKTQFNYQQTMINEMREEILYLRSQIGYRFD